MLLILEIALGMVLGYIVIINLELVFTFVVLIFKYVVISSIVIGLLLTTYHFLFKKQYVTEPNVDLSLVDIFGITVSFLAIIYSVVITLGMLGHLLSLFRKHLYSITFTDCLSAWRENKWLGYLKTWEFFAERCPQGAIVLGCLFVVFVFLMFAIQIIKQI